jgi:RNA 3'-terminal phosphate cyclase (ATP)
LADQLMLPLALAGAGRFSMSAVSQHARTNAEVIARFLPVKLTFVQQGERSICTVEVSENFTHGVVFSVQK